MSVSAWSGVGDEQASEEAAAADDQTHALWWSGVPDDAGGRRNPAVAAPRPSERPSERPTERSTERPNEPPAGPVGPPGMPPSTWTGPAYAAAVRPVNVATPTSRAVYVWAFLAILGGAAVIVGSVTTWLTIKAFGHSFRLAGTDSATSTVRVHPTGSNSITVTTAHLHSGHGWITVALGGAIVVFSAVLMLARPALLRLLPLLAALGALGYGIYEIVDIQSNIDTARHAARTNVFAFIAGVNAHLGYGLIVVVAGAGVAVLASFGAARSP